MRLGHLALLPPTLVTLLLTATAWAAGNEPRSLSALVEEDLQKLVALQDPVKNLDPYDPNSHLFKILIPRAPDTDNNTFVRNHIVSTLKGLDWNVEEDSFVDNTPYGEKTFVNIIATKDQNAPRRMIMSAHFDSKYFPRAPQNQFLGATDSAAPCAMLLDLAESLNPLLEARKKRLNDGTASEAEREAAESTLQLVFFDGEEAFKDWTATDSLYGSRHLAEKWSKEYVSNVQERKLNTGGTQITAIDHFVLLDLLGSPQPLIRSYFASTSWLFDGMVAIEHRLGELGYFNEAGSNNADGGDWSNWNSFFVPRTGYDHMGGRIDDDHRPFLEKGVNVLHVIASPFPHVWHTIKDDASALDIPTMKRWNLIFRVFTAEYMRLSPTGKALFERSNSELHRFSLDAYLATGLTALHSGLAFLL